MLSSATAAPAGSKPPATPATTSTAAAAAADPAKFSSDELAGRRLIVLLFDTSSMEPEDVQRVDRLGEEVRRRADVAGRSHRRRDRQHDARRAHRLHRRSREGRPTALNKLAYTEGTATPPPDAATMATDELAAAAEETTATETSELDMFNNDVRLRALKTLAETLDADRAEEGDRLLQRRHAAQRRGQPGRAARGGERRGARATCRSTPSTRAVCRRSCPAATRGRWRRRSRWRRRPWRRRSRSVLRRLRHAAVRVAGVLAGHAHDASPRTPAVRRSRTRTTSARRSAASIATCPRTTSSATAARTPPRDGRFRRIQVRVKKDDAAHRSARRLLRRARLRAHREQRPRDADPGAVVLRRLGDRPAGLRRRRTTSASRPTSTTCRSRSRCPASAVPVPAGKDKVTLDILGMLFDELRPAGRTHPPDDGRCRPAPEKTLAGKQVLYQSGMTLPPGRFWLKVVVRENENGLTGRSRRRFVFRSSRRNAAQGQLRRAEHAAPGRAEGPDPTTRSCATASSSSPTSRTSSDAIRSCSSTTRSTIRRSRAGKATGASHEPRVLSRQGEGDGDAGRGRARRSTPAIARPRCSSSRSRRTGSRRASTPARSTSSTRSRATSRSRGSSCWCANILPCSACGSG